VIPPVGPLDCLSAAEIIAGIATGWHRRTFAAIAEGGFPEVPELPETAGDCSPELPEMCEMQCGEYGVALIEPILLKVAEIGI
jgi:hypothetical protein